MTVKRYDHDVSGDYTSYSYMDERDNGDYVEYVDHKKIVDELEARIETLKLEYDQAMNEFMS